MNKISENEAIEVLKSTAIMRYEANGGQKSYLGAVMGMAVKALEKQEKLKERIAELTEKRKPWEEMFVGAVVEILEEFVVEG